MRKVPHGLRYMNVWRPVGGTIWEGSGGVTLLAVSLETSFPSVSLPWFLSSLCLSLVAEPRSLSFLLLWPCGLLPCLPVVMGSLLWNRKLGLEVGIIVHRALIYPAYSKPRV